MSPQVQRIIVALGYALSALVATLTATGTPANTEAWIGLVIAAVVAFWGKYSSSTTVFAANRAPWTEAQRALANIKK
jgi:cytochrome b